MSFAKLAIRDAEYVVDTASSQYVYHVKDPHALIQAAGYLKYIQASNSPHGRAERIFFRGQTKLYPSLSPSLFRGCKSENCTGKRIKLLNKAVEAFSSKHKTFSSLHKKCQETILQHYGLSTTWIDLVDNVWVALWFACHRAHASGKMREYLHFEKRSPDKEVIDAFAYVLMVAVDANTAIAPGVLSGDETEFVDLREASPSVFLRPHAQHGVLFKCRWTESDRPSDYIKQVRGIIRINLKDAIDWLGTGKMLGVHALFPPPYYDKGYAFLLDSGYSGSPDIGSIHHIGA